jgi:ankyrin repeat protein
MPSSIRKALNELPVTLDDTYERLLQGIPKEKSHHACRLLQCMVAARRPLHVEELAEIFAIEFGPNNVPNLVAGWRPENPEEAVLSACSTLIATIEDEGAKTVQFSHFSVKEFLTSDRLQMSDVSNIRQYHIPLEPAHTILARACLTVLLQVDEKVGEQNHKALPLASYAARNWVMHAEFEDVASHIQDSMECLFNPRKPHFRAWISLPGALDYDSRPSSTVILDFQPRVTPLYCAASCGFARLVKHLIITHGEDVNETCTHQDMSPLHAASRGGHIDCARLLLDHGAYVHAQNIVGWAPIHFASYDGHLSVAQLLHEHGANLHAPDVLGRTPLSMASGSESGCLEIVRFLLDHGADVSAPTGWPRMSLFQAALRNRRHDVAQLLLEYGAEREPIGWSKAGAASY